MPPFYSMLNENTAGVMVDDYILDSLPDREPTTIQSSCMELWRGVLLDFFHCRTAHFQGSTRQRQIDKQWLESESTAVESFHWVCHHLNLDPKVVRTAYTRGLPLSLSRGLTVGDRQRNRPLNGKYSGGKIHPRSFQHSPAEFGRASAP
jgi:hypothetical protein